MDLLFLLLQCQEKWISKIRAERGSLYLRSFKLKKKPTNLGYSYYVSTLQKKQQQKTSYAVKSSCLLRNSGKNTWRQAFLRPSNWKKHMNWCAAEWVLGCMAHNLIILYLLNVRIHQYAFLFLIKTTILGLFLLLFFNFFCCLSILPLWQVESPIFVGIFKSVHCVVYLYWNFRWGNAYPCIISDITEISDGHFSYLTLCSSWKEW